MPRYSIRVICSLLFAFALAFAAGASQAAGNDPGLRHTYFMAGSVIESSGQSVYLCIGSPDGAKVGETLDVIRVTRDHTVNPKQGNERFQHAKVGTVRIDAIVDEHYAKATAITGVAEKGDIVQLSETAAGTMEH